MGKPIVDYQTPQPSPSPVSSILECVPAVLAMSLYIAFQFDLLLPRYVKLLFWPCWLIAAITALTWLVSRRTRTRQLKQWYVQAQIACHSIVLIVTAFVILLFVAGALISGR